MKTKIVLFDLDGTLLPMDQDEFVKAYLGGIAKKLAPYGYDSDRLVGAIWKGTKAMIDNDGQKRNEEVFWAEFQNAYGEAIVNNEHFDAFYEEDFDKVQLVCGYNDNAKKILDKVISSGRRAVLATNPIFPPIATKKRIAWAGLDVQNFDFITTYDNSRFCKPNLDYYREILQRLGVAPEECLMVGNDVDEDMVASKLGMKVFLLTDCLINRHSVDVSIYPHGGFEELSRYLDSLD